MLPLYYAAERPTVGASQGHKGAPLLITRCCAPSPHMGCPQGARRRQRAAGELLHWSHNPLPMPVPSISNPTLQGGGEALPGELLHELKAHDGPVLAVRFNRAGTYCLSAGRVRIRVRA